MKEYKHYIPLILLIVFHYLLSHLHTFFDLELAKKMYLLNLNAYPVIVMFVMFKFSSSFKKIQQNIASNILFYVFWGDFAFFSVRRVLIHFKVLESYSYFQDFYIPFLVVLVITSILAYIYRNKLDFNRLKSDSYDKLGCYVIAEYPKKWYEFLWSLIYGIPVSSFGILMNGYVYEYDKNTKKLKDRYKVQDITQYKLKRVKVNKDSLKSRLNGYEGKFSLFTNNCRFIEDIMGRTVQFYYK